MAQSIYSSFVREGGEYALLVRARYRSALAINNIGVGLLEKKCYAQAASVLKGATSLMNHVLNAGCDEDHSENAVEVSGGGEDLVNEAMQQLAHPQAFGTTVLPLKVLTRVSGGGLIDDANNDSVATAIQQSVHTGGSLCSSVAFPIRLEDTIPTEGPLLSLQWPSNDLSNSSDSCTGLTLSLQTAAMLHNLGICYLTLSKTDASRREKLLRTSIRLFRKSYGILAKQYNLLHLQAAGCPEWHRVGLPLMFIAVLTTLIKSLQESEEDDKALQLEQNLVQLQATASQMERVHLFSPKSAPSA
jgi:hypothetical protein